MSGSDRNRSPRRVQTQIWTLNASLAAAGAALGLLAANAGRTGDLARHSSPWILAALFALFEVLVVHVRFRDDAHTFSMAEAALALGLLTLAPLELLLAQAIGAGLVFALHRRLPLIKLVFNLAQQWVGTAVAILVAHLVLGGGDALGPRAWAAVALAVIAASLVGASSILVVLRLSTGSVSLASHLGATAFAMVNSLLSASIGLVGVVVLAARPTATILLAVPAASVFATNLAYVTQREKHQRLEFLYGATQSLAASQQLDQGLVALLEQMRVALRCDFTALVFRPLDASDHVRVSMAASDGRVLSMQTVERERLGDRWWSLVGSDDAWTPTPPKFLDDVMVGEHRGPPPG